MIVWALAPTIAPVGPRANTIAELEGIVALVLGLATRLAGIAIFVMLAVGALQLITAGSNQEQAQKAKAVLTQAAAGGALLILIWLILKFIADFTGLPEITGFTICFPGFSGVNCD